MLMLTLFGGAWVWKWSVEGLGVGRMAEEQEEWHPLLCGLVDEEEVRACCEATLLFDFFRRGL